MKTYRVLKTDKLGKLLLEGASDSAANPFEFKVNHKIKLKPKKLMRKLWTWWW